MDIEITLTEVRNVLVLGISGRVDSLTAITLGEHLLAAWEQDQHHLVLDLSDVDYVSSAGLREIMNALARTKKSGGNLCLVNPSPRVKELLELTGLDHHLGIFATRDEALQSFA